MANTATPFTTKTGLTVQGGDTRLESTGSVKLPLGTTAQRPSVPEPGMMRGNTETSSGTEIYVQNQWWELALKNKWLLRAADTIVPNGSTSYGVLLNTTAGVLNVSLPTTPGKDDTIIIADGFGKFATNNAFVDPGSLLINGVAGPITLKYKNQCIVLSYSGNASVGWVLVSNQYDMTQFATESEETAFVFALIL